MGSSRFDSTDFEMSIGHSKTPSKLDLMNLLPAPKVVDKHFKVDTFSKKLKLRRLIEMNGFDHRLNKAFIPVNPREAKVYITRPFIYDFINDPSNKQSRLTLAKES